MLEHRQVDKSLCRQIDVSILSAVIGGRPVITAVPPPDEGNVCRLVSVGPEERARN
jgi:hypothetical protein